MTHSQIFDILNFMTATEKYLAMNNEFCRLRDAIYNPDVDEAEEDERIWVSPSQKHHKEDNI